MSVKDGRIVLPDGMSHRVLILPDNQPMAQEALRKVADLIEAGAIVIGPAPTGLAGSPLQPDDEEKFEALVKWSWGGNRSSEAAVQRRIGAGYLVSGQSTRQVLVDAGVPPDFEHSGLTDNGSIYWIHRKTEDATSTSSPVIGSPQKSWSAYPCRRQAAGTVGPRHRHIARCRVVSSGRQPHDSPRGIRSLRLDVCCFPQTHRRTCDQKGEDKLPTGGWISTGASRRMGG